MDFEWDKEKQISNLKKHGFNFAEINKIVAKQHVILPLDYELEERHKLIGFYGDDNVEVTVIHTVRQGVFRIISLRRARDGERRLLYNGGSRPPSRPH